eukprot:1724369-Amphidinium_carterae.1
MRQHGKRDCFLTPWERQHSEKNKSARGAVLGVAPPAALSCGGRSRVVLAKGDEYDALDTRQLRSKG